jgi:hypothetical protein
MKMEKNFEIEKDIELEKELNSRILQISMKILEKHSELAEHLDEMPMTIPNMKNPEINIKILKDYLESLENILEHFEKKDEAFFFTNIDE